MTQRWTHLSRFVRTLTSADLRSGLHRLGTGTRALAVPYTRDEREALALLVLPVLLVASAIMAHQSMRALRSYVAVIAMPEHEIAPVWPRAAGDVPLAALPRSTARATMPEGETGTVTAVADLPPAESIAAPETGLASASLEAAARPVAALEDRSAPPADRLAPVVPAPYSAAAETRSRATLALLAPAGEMHRSLRPLSPDAIETFEADAGGKPIRPGICAMDERPRTDALPLPAPAGVLAGRDGEAFGLRLAAAAQAQVGGFVIYNDAYRRISYPMGDVHPLYGVCTDLVVRAYRALGIDLQVLVRSARAGVGDASIDHRRTEILRRFFAAHGESLPVTSFPEDYRPGDIVTYYRPQNRSTRAHIAIVSSVLAPSGRPMIVHNRGWGPQLEDALFVDEITGHYRYRGPAPAEHARTDKRDGPASRLGAPVVPASLRAPRLAPAERRY